jgi:YVTN family beta-propeller protein
VAIFDARTHKVLRTIDFDRDPAAPERVQAVGIVLAPDGRRAFVALGRGNHVAEVDAQSGRILRYYPVGIRNWGIALSPDQHRLYAANGISGDLSIIDLAAGRTTTLRLGGKPWGAVSAP